MMRWLVASSLRMRLIVLAMAAGLIVGGAARARQMPVDALPDFAPPTIEVQTEAPGLSAPEVENLVTLNLEELVNGTPWLRSVHSSSLPGLSRLLLTFAPGTDIMKARQLVNERLTLAYTIPNVAQPPVILQPQSSANRVLMVGLSSKTVSPIEMGVLTRWTIRPALLAVPGVANVAVWGQRERQLQVQVDPARLLANGITLDQIIHTTGNAMWMSPLSFLQASTPGTGGWIDTPQQRLEVRHVFPISTPKDLSRVAIDGANPLRLGDVARVVEGHQPLIGNAVLTNGQDMLLVIDKFPNANTLAVTRGVEHALDELRPGLAGVHIDTSVSRPATFIQESKSNLSTAVLIGAALLLLCFAVLLYDVWAVVIGAVAIAAAMGAALLVLDVRGATVNLLVVAGLLIAMALLVDDAIAGSAGVLERLRAARASGETVPRSTLIVEGSLQARRGFGYATLIALMPLLPFLFSGGMQRMVIEPLVVSYALAVIASALIALTVTPALTYILAGHRPTARRASPVVTRLQAGYSHLLERVVRRPSAVLVVSAVTFAGGLAAMPFLGQALLPSFHDPALVIGWNAAPGTSQAEVSRVVERADRRLAAIPGVTHVGAHVGRAVMGDQFVDVNSSELWVDLSPSADYAATVAAVRRTVGGYPGIRHQVRSYLDDRVHAFETAPAHDITVRVFGPAYGTLQATAVRLRHLLRAVPGVTGISMQHRVFQPTVDVRVKLAQARSYGLKPGDVRRAAATLLAGLEVGSLFQHQKVFQVMVWSTPASRHSLTTIRNLLIDTPTGGHVRLEDLADVRISPTPTSIVRDQVSRRLDLGVDVGGRDPGAVAADIRHTLAGTRMPLEYHAEVIGNYQSAVNLHRRMVASGLAAAIAIFLLLQAAFQSWRIASLLTLTLPVSLSGGALAALATDTTISLPALAAFLAVLAIAARGVIALFKEYQELERSGAHPVRTRLVVQGARNRMPATLMTALAMLVALLPLLVTGPQPGQELAQPIAIVLAGGLVTATLYSLFLAPVIYLLFGPRAAPVPAVPGPPVPRHRFSIRRREHHHAATP